MTNLSMLRKSYLVCLSCCMLTRRFNRVKSWFVDGGSETRGMMGLADEPLAPQALIPDTPQANAMDIWAINAEKVQLNKGYMDYWNSTAKETGTGRPVDAIICPLAPFPAARENGYTYYNYSIWVNCVDYTSVVIPVTNVDKSVDKKDDSFKAKDDTDQKTQDSCEYQHAWSVKFADQRIDDPELYHGSPVAIQLVGRRLQEEKMIALAKYVGEALHGKARAL